MNTKYTLRWIDGAKALLIAVGTAVIPSLIDILNTGNFPTPIQFRNIGIAALSAGLMYILKNFFTDDVKQAQNTLVDASKKAPTSEDQQSITTPILQAQIDHPKPNQ